MSIKVKVWNGTDLQIISARRTEKLKELVDKVKEVF